jgi:hypothetical protein
MEVRKRDGRSIMDEVPEHESQPGAPGPEVRDQKHISRKYGQQAARRPQAEDGVPHPFQITFRSLKQASVLGPFQSSLDAESPKKASISPVYTLTSAKRKQMQATRSSHPG